MHKLAPTLTCLGLLLPISACASTRHSPEALLPAATSTPNFLEDFQRSGGTGNLRQTTFHIPNSQANVLALNHVLEIAQFRFQTAATNIVNMDTTLDADGKNDPYLRLLVTIDSAGQVHAIPEPTAIILKYEPANSCADANGFVKVPAITLDEESLNLKFTVTEFETATTALKEFKGR